ncbi:extracellular catalytic domain type 1 short-chain-length polyhydroxyalkanoate depolymerase [Rhodopila sp.]|uniref:extracellular catalytic domain type 1 short-chain-length polyhydroxyalkanoate depolymerase n=1 Tax=Rhodopila sp. TaxID=2480087 RepID=UPI003D0F5D6E
MKLTRNLRGLRRGIRLVSRIAKAQIAPPEQPRPPSGPGRMVTYSGFGDNPGRLKMLTYLPPDVAGRPLVVLLHGCGQDAASFAADSGWIELADRLHFPLILPEQMEANNAGRCFQWFQASDTARDAGEAASIAGMTEAAISLFDSNPRRVFILGLSAGGAMAVALLAAYPDLFAAGASVAGLPVGTAQSGMQAIMRMASGGPALSADVWAARVRSAAPAGFAGPWPRLSICQGQADNTVAPDNANLLATQWCALHGVSAAMMTNEVRDGVRHQTWSDQTGQQVELWWLPLMAHGYPVGTRIVQPGRFVLQAPLDATAAIARFFELD